MIYSIELQNLNYREIVVNSKSLEQLNTLLTAQIKTQLIRRLILNGAD